MSDEAPTDEPPAPEPEPTKLCSNKPCAKVRGPQPLSAFNNDRKTKTGKQAHCRLCQKAANKARINVKVPKSQETIAAERRARALALAVKRRVEPGMDSHADRLDYGVGVAIEFLIDTIEMPISAQDKDFARLVAGKIRAAGDLVKLQARVDGHRLRRAAADGLAKLLSRIADEEKKILVDVTPPSARP